MIWLASYPRSGNTYTRNILKQVFGIESGYDDEPGWESFEVVKTHFLPHHIKSLKPTDKVIYLVRDGRDCICSLAHHMKDIANTGDHLIQNMSESIIAAEGSYFGGWSNHVFHWTRRADIVIRYEDLIDNPQQCFDIIGQIIELPSGDWSQLPSFQKLKSSKNPYGIVKKEWEADPSIAYKFYRKGKSGNWKEEMPERIEALFWSCHGDIMERIGYQRSGEIWDHDFFYEEIQTFQKQPKLEKEIVHVLLEAQKLMDVHHDGVFRYLHSLIEAMRRQQINRRAYSELKIDLLINGQIRPLYSDLEDFAAIDKKFVKSFKDSMWQLYNYFPPMLKRWSVSAVNFYFFLKANFHLFLNRKKFEEYDVLHFPLPQNYYAFRFVRDGQFLCTVHDLTHHLFPEHHVKRNVSNAAKGFQFIKKRKAYCIAVSSATKCDLQREEGIPEDRIQVIYEAADREVFNHIYDTDRVDKVLEGYGLERQQYFFSLATLEPRKNLKKTLEAFIHFKDAHPSSGIVFVAAGKLGWKEKLGFNNRKDIVHLGYVGEGELPALYSGALGFAYVSKYEGFGLPLLEAMRCQVPVIYGANSSMKEIVGPHGLGVDAESTLEISNAFGIIFEDEVKRTELIKKGYCRALEFSWDQAAMSTMELYTKLSRTSKDQEQNQTV